MQTTAAIEQNILNNIRQLPPDQQQAVLDFSEALRKKLAPNKLSMRQIAKLPLAERHQYLASYISNTAKDFLTDPELIELSVLDTSDWEPDHD